jgi:hypothetical protein
MRESMLHKSTQATQCLCGCRATECGADHALSKQEQALVISLWLNHAIAAPRTRTLQNRRTLKLCRSRSDVENNFQR